MARTELVRDLFSLWRKMDRHKIEFLDVQGKMYHLLLVRRVLWKLHDYDNNEDSKKNLLSIQPKAQVIADFSEKLMDKFLEIEKVFEELEKIEEEFKLKLK